MDLEQLLRAAFVLRAPKADFEDVVMARVSVAAKSGMQGKTGRRILMGVVLAVAAAASMLTLQLTRKPEVAAAVTTPVPVAEEPATPVARPVAVAAVEPVMAKPRLPASTQAAEPASAGAKGEPAEVPAAATRFIVRMQPLRNDAKEVDARAAIDLYYTSLLDGLRAVPGLTLIQSETVMPNVIVPGEFSLTVDGSAPQPGKVGLRLMEGIIESRDGKSIGARFVTSQLADVVASCANPPDGGAERAICNDPASLAANAVDALRVRVFPADPSLRQYLQARLTDARLAPALRLKALTDLSALKDGGAYGRPAKLDDAAIRGAIELAARSPDAATRARVWNALQGNSNAELLQPLIAALRDDPDGEVRLQAVVILGADFATEERVRAALSAAARDDARPLVRALAQRGLTGDADWKEYVISSLQDANRPVAERVEAFMYHMYQPSPGGGFRVGMASTKFLDDEVIEALGKVLPQAMALPDVRRLTGQLVSDLVQTGSSAAYTMLSELLEQSGEPGLRRAIVTQLGRRATELRVRSILEKVSSGDSDPQVRQAAAQALSVAPASSQQPPSGVRP